MSLSASQRLASSFSNLSASNDVHMDRGNEEEEDIDFNPVLRDETSSEASSSLRSDNGPGDIIDNNNLLNSADCPDISGLSKPTDEVHGYSPNYASGEGAVMQIGLEEAYRRDSLPRNLNKGDLISSIQQGATQIHPVGDHSVTSYGDGSNGDGSNAAHELTKENLQGQTTNSLNSVNLQRPVVQVDDEDAICRRTRARHSLANYTLEELETFLQESDDEDLQNVDDEEEYNKFLAAVLLGVHNEQTEQEGENLDEDEDNDADFVIEIEEALENDVDESLNANRGQSEKQDGDVHRPETRQKKRLKESIKNQKHVFSQAKMPLRPILPYVSNGQVDPFPSLGWQSYPNSLFKLSSPSRSDLINGFTTQQIGQLYSLLHEHVQLLIQTFSVCVLDPCRQQVSIEVQKMISKMVEKREEVLARRKDPYPEPCFLSQNLHSSACLGIHQTAKWAPSINNPILSVLDVAPLGLARQYLTEVSDTVLSYSRSHLESDGDRSQFTREPLFPLTFASHIITPTNTAQPLSPGEIQTKRSLAATIVENTKKQSVALVPKEISKLAQKFYPLFNAALFPHKPPLQSVANRVLFTDAEDGLLAMGIMEYNNDWTAIQHHFLPCKSQHQIFVRQKNRSSSKASENPIKVVRRMKSASLTADEMTRINEGLKCFRNDWLSVWRFILPHRDPSLLPRQWKIAKGTQKSYKKSEAENEKRRVYDAKRKNSKGSATDCQTLAEKKVGDGENTEGDINDKAYVHEAFLADDEPRISKHMSHDIRLSSISRRHIQANDLTGNMTSRISHAGCSSAFTAFSSQLPSNSIPRPSRKDKKKQNRVVKLAPYLPPVNLPSSVRVISRSDFEGYSSDYLKTGNNTGFPQVSKEGTSAKPGDHANMFSAHGPKTNRQYENVNANQYVEEENSSASDLHMHPLLFRASEQFPSYYPKSCTATGTYNFFPEIPLQSEFNILRSQDSVITRSHVAPTSESDLNMHTIDFHPLLHRLDNVSGGSAIMPVDKFSRDVETLHRNSDKFPNPSECVTRDPMAADRQMVTDTSSSHNEKEHFLDLDICLYSATGKEKRAKGIDTSEKDLHGDKLFLSHGDKCPHFSVATNFSNKSRACIEKGVSSIGIVSPSNCLGCRCPEDSRDESVPEIVMEQEELSDSGCQYPEDSHDESVPGIVMEQEELSDSDEEVQHVEFECEEMEDSEGEALDSHQPAIQTKEFLNLALKEAVTQAIHDSTQPSVEKGEISTIPNQVAIEDPSHALNPKHEGPNRTRPRRSSSIKRHSRPSQKKLRQAQNTEGSRTQGLLTQQLNPNVGELQGFTLRKYRKRPLSK